MKKLLKRTCLLALALAFVLSAFTGALAETIWGYVDVTGATVNVRKGPGLDYNSSTVLNAGAKLAYLGETSIDTRGVAWYKISYDDVTGWVSSKYTELHQRIVTATSGQTYIRSYGNLEASELGVLHEGEVASYLEQTQYDSRGVAWYKISYNGTIGWVSSKYTTMKEDTQPVYNLIVTATDGQTRLRTTPSLNGSEITVMQKGDSATYLNASSVDERGVVWYKVQYKNHSGWVSSKYTELR